MARKSIFDSALRGMGLRGDSAEVTVHNEAVSAFCTSLDMGTGAVFASPTRENLEEMIKRYNDSCAKASAYSNDPKTSEANKDRLNAVQQNLTEYYNAMIKVGGVKLYMLKVFLEAAEAGPPAKQSLAELTKWFESYSDLAGRTLVEYKKDFSELLSAEDEVRLDTFKKQFTEMYEVLSVNIEKVEAGMDALREMDKSNPGEVVAAIRKLQKNIGALNNPQLEPPLTAENRSYLDAAKVELTQLLQVSEPGIQATRILDFTAEFEALKAEVEGGRPFTLTVPELHRWIDEQRAAIDSLLSKTALRDKWPELESLKFNHLLERQSRIGPPSDLSRVERLQWTNDRLEEVARLPESAEVRKMTTAFKEAKRLAQLAVASEDNSVSNSVKPTVPEQAQIPASEMTRKEYNQKVKAFTGVAKLSIPSAFKPETADNLEARIEYFDTQIEKAERYLVDSRTTEDNQNFLNDAIERFEAKRDTLIAERPSSEEQHRDEVSTQQHVQPPPPKVAARGAPGINFADLMNAQQSREDRVPEEGVEVATRQNNEHYDEQVDTRTDAEKLQEAVANTLGNLKKRDITGPDSRQRPIEEVQETLSPLEQMRARNAAKKQQQGTGNTSGTESPTSVAGGRNTPEQEPERPAWMKNLKTTKRVEQPTSTAAPQIPEWQRKQQEKLKAQTDALRRDEEGPTQETGHGNDDPAP
ncbi:MAG: hypothetical protein K0U37_06685 [Gammaproteobacteria bacterium]|nr:hypothetical protein [Gammaproteobacteria bacterium]